METNSVAADYSPPAKETRTPKKVLDRNDFLKLLTEQLKNQDPLDPQSNDEFITTMTQFSSLETLTSLDKTVQYSQAVSMINRSVTVQQTNKDPVTGTVEKVGIVDGNVVVYVEGNEYKLSEVKETLVQEPSQEIAGGGDLIQAALMIGKEVLIGDGDEQQWGIVEKVGLSQGAVKLYVNGNPYDISGITGIREAGQAAEDTGVPEE